MDPDGHDPLAQAARAANGAGCFGDSCARQLAYSYWRNPAAVSKSAEKALKVETVIAAAPIAIGAGAVVVSSAWATLSAAPGAAASAAEMLGGFGGPALAGAGGTAQVAIQAAGTWHAETMVAGAVALVATGLTMLRDSKAVEERAARDAGTAPNGQAINSRGEKLGPSGKPMHHHRAHKNKHQAQRAAQDRSAKGAKAINHPRPIKGRPHSHAAKKQAGKDLKKTDQMHDDY